MMDFEFNASVRRFGLLCALNNDKELDWSMEKYIAFSIVYGLEHEHVTSKYDIFNRKV